MNQDFVFCYWDDPVDWRNEQQARHSNRIQNFYKKQEISNEDSKGHVCGRPTEHKEKKSSSAKRMDT